MNSTTGRYAALDILDRTFRIYRENFVPIIGFVALITIPVTLIDQLFTSSVTANLSSLQTTGAPTNVNAGASVIGSLVVIVLSVLQIVLVYSVLSYLTSESYLGRKTTIGEAFNATRSRLFSLGCGFVLFYIVLVVFAVVIILLATACSPAVIALVVIAYIGLATFALLTPVIVLENVRASAGVNRAYSLGRARFWTMLIVLAAIYIVSLVLNVALTAVVGLLGTPTVGSSFSGVQFISPIATTIVGILITPLFPIAMTLIYFDTRTRVEGLDLALAALDKPDARPSDLESPSAGPLFTSRDLLNMVILGIGGVVLAVVAGGLLGNIINSVAPGLTLPR